MNSLSELKTDKPRHESEKKKQVPELWQILIECRDEAEQRELFERLRREGRKVRLMVL